MENVKNGNLAEMSVLFERYHLKLYNFFHEDGSEERYKSGSDTESVLQDDKIP